MTLIYMTARWRIQRQPGVITDPMVVRFLMFNSNRKRLDQNARWTGDGWDPQRWVPRAPIVPQPILRLVEQHMWGVQP